MNTAKRSPAADLIRIFAFFCVVSVHFFLHTDFYSRTVQGKRMFVLVLLRSFFTICVPLFMTLSGYLLRRKTLEKSYYKRIGGILLTYLLVSLLCILYRIVFLGVELTLGSMILKILDYTAAPYAWYIEMYLGLSLLIPFINILYNGLPSQKSKLILILTMVALTGLPSILNIYDLTTFDPASTVMHQVIPDSWNSLYPLTYYFIGCYLSEYGLKIKKRVNILLILLVAVLSGSFCYWRCYETTFHSGLWCDYPSLFNTVLTTLVFTLFINTDFSRMPAGLAKLIQKISGLCLGAYLVSWIFDNELYPIMLEKVPYITKNNEYGFILVPVIFILSLCASFCIHILQHWIEKFFAILSHTLRKSQRT